MQIPNALETFFIESFIDKATLFELLVFSIVFLYQPKIQIEPITKLELMTMRDCRTESTERLFHIPLLSIKQTAAPYLSNCIHLFNLYPLRASL